MIIKKLAPEISKNRIGSIDTFRGITIFTMIFVNDLASIKGMPNWLEHAPADANTMTFVDVVFPAFLFIVGMAIPFAINKRLEKGDNQITIWKHILIRTAGLLVLGILMVNISDLNEKATGMDKHIWMFLIFAGAILTWNIYPKVKSNKKIIFTALRITGILLLIFLAAIYRSGPENNIAWLHTKWWGILGLIGWAYLFTCIAYFLVKGSFWKMIPALFFFIFLYVLDYEGVFNFTKPFLQVGGHIGVHTSITIAGLLISMLFFDDAPAKSSKEKIIWIIIYSAILFAAGIILSPIYGISKIYATPSWGLLSSAYCGWIFAFFYWLIDIKKQNKWTKFFEPAGKNPLLAYILPDIYYSIAAFFGFTFFYKYFGEGIPGLIRSIIFALIMVQLTALLNKMKIKLHL